MGATSILTSAAPARISDPSGGERSNGAVGIAGRVGSSRDVETESGDETVADAAMLEAAVEDSDTARKSVHPSQTLALQGVADRSAGLARVVAKTTTTRRTLQLSLILRSFWDSKGRALQLCAE